MEFNVSELDIISVASKIEERINDIATGRELLKPAAELKARTMAEYEKRLAVVIMALRNGKEFELESEKIKDPPISIIDKVSKGLCYKEKIAADLAEAEYKRMVIKLDCLKTEMNGFQSINRYLDTCKNGD
jgi:hypothetical protein